MGYEGEEIEGYYCLLIAILGNFDASEARFLYEYGPDHPVCQKILKKRPPPVNFAKMSKEDINRCIYRLFIGTRMVSTSIHFRAARAIRLPSTLYSAAT